MSAVIYLILIDAFAMVWGRRMAWGSGREWEWLL